MLFNNNPCKHTNILLKLKTTHHYSFFSPTNFTINFTVKETKMIWFYKIYVLNELKTSKHFIDITKITIR